MKTSRSALPAALFFFAFLPLPSRAQQAPLPDPSALLLKVKANQHRIEELRHNYICKESDDIDELDKDGAVKKHETAEYDFYWQGRVQVRRLTSKNGKPLSPDELRKEDEKLDKAKKKAEEKLEKREAEGNESANIGIDTFLRASIFQNERRELYQGHPVIAMSVVPNPQFKPNTMAERIVHLLEGTVWIDEEAAQIVRLEAHLGKSYKMAGGLAFNIREGSGARLEQQHINGEVWMPSLADINVQGRALLFAGIHQHIIQHFTNYQKFRADTKILAIDPAPSEAK